MKQQLALYDIIKRPVLTEKSNLLKEEVNKVVVEVCPKASKSQIKSAAKVVFGVDVLSVNTLIYRGKLKRHGRHFGKQRNTKRAYLTLKNGTDVDLFGLVGQETSQQ